MRTAALRAGIGLVCIAVLGVVAAQATGAKSSTVSIGLNPQATTLEAGLALNYFPGFKFPSVDNGVDALALMKSGSIEGYMDVSAPPIAIALATGIPIKVIWIDYQEKDALVTKPEIKSAQ